MYRKMTADNSHTWYTWIQSVATHLNQKKRKKLYNLSANECYEEKNVEFLRVFLSCFESHIETLEDS